MNNTKPIQMFRSVGANAMLPVAPVAFLGSYDAENKANIMAIAWYGIVNSQPPIMSVSVRRERKSYDNIIEKKAFTLSIPHENQAKELDFTGIISGKVYDKFSTLGLTACVGEHVEAPYVGECPFVVEMSLVSSQELGTHICFFGEVMDIKIHENCFDEDKKIIPAQILPLVFSPLTREYKALGSSQGRAYSVGRTYKI